MMKSAISLVLLALFCCTFASPLNETGSKHHSARGAPNFGSPGLLLMYYVGQVTSGGAGQTIAIVSQYGYQNTEAEADLLKFSTKYGYPECSFANGCLRINRLQPMDLTYPGLDLPVALQIAHAAAPNAKKLVINYYTNENLEVALKSAAAQAQYVVCLFGYPEFMFESSSAPFNKALFAAGTDPISAAVKLYPTVSFFGYTGDTVGRVTYPASHPNVIAVGATSRDAFSEIGFTNGGGCSAYFIANPFQSRSDTGYANMGCNGKRAVPDISFNADGGVPYVYNGVDQWWRGTSASVAVAAAMAAVLGIKVDAGYFYSNQAHFRDIVSGSSGSYSAQSGYDLVTGLGSWLSMEYFNYKPSFLGYYKDSASGYDINGIININRPDLTPIACQVWCAKQGYEFAGVQGGNQCACGKTYGRYGKAYNPRGLVSVCTGDSNQYCGGPLVNSVYTTPFPKYIGCFADSTTRDLSGPTIQTPDNNPYTCSLFCSQAGYLYAGVQYGQNCFCGNSFGSYGYSQCNMACASGSSAKCGDAWANGIFESGYVGCFADSTQRDLDMYYGASNDMNIEKCRNICHGYGKLYAGLQNSNQCFCGNSYGRYGTSNACTSGCAGYNNLGMQRCGGAWANSVFTAIPKL